MQSFKVVEAVGKHSGTVIFLHGLGDQGTSFIPVAKQIQRSCPHLKFVLPTAKTIPITLNGGYPMPGWFDVNTLDRLDNSIHDDEAGMLRSVAAVEGLVDAELERGIQSERIVLGGFSQGCVIATLTGLRTKRKLGGVISLSGWVPLSHKVQEMIDPGAKDLAFFWGHGRDDPVVRYDYGKKSISLLQSLPNLSLPLITGKTFQRPSLRFETYEGMGHSLCAEELEHMAEWLKEAVPSQ